MQKTISTKTTFFNFFRNIFKISFLEKILRKVTKNKSPKAFLSKLAPNNYQYPQPSTRQIIQNRIAYELNISDFVDWHIYFGFKDEAKEHLYNLVKTGHTVIDVGANVGEVSLNCARLVGEKGRVISFEPHPDNYQRCRKNLALNRILKERIALINKGLGEKYESFEIAAVDAFNAGKNRILSTENTDTSIPTNTIMVAPLDSFAEQLEVSRVDLIKVDVEGFEMNVLRGSIDIIQRFRPKLFIEINDEHLKAQGSSAKDLVAFLTDLDYQVYRADDKSPVDISTDFRHCHYDIIADWDI